MHRMLMIVNPRSGKELMRGRLLDTLNIFCAAGYIPEVYVTQKEGDGTIEAQELCPDAELIVCCGGDGTLNNVVTGMLKRDNIPKLGYIPGGSTNDFARSLSLPADILKAAERIVSGKLFPIDIGQFGKDRFFAYIAAFGAFTEISYETPQDIKNLLGHQAYLIESIKHLSSLKSHHLKIEWDDNVLEEEFVFGMITNTISVGGFKGLVTQNVSLNDGLFEVLLIRTPRTPADFSNVISYMFLKEQENEYVFRFKASSLKVTSAEPVDWVLDGEYGGAVTEAQITNLNQALVLTL